MRLSKVEIHKRSQKEEKFINEWKMAVTYLTGKKNGVRVREVQKVYLCVYVCINVCKCK
jgi:hypothetical protein